MSDEELIRDVACMWVDAGGDAEGLAWSFEKLKAAISDEIAVRASIEIEGERAGREE